MNLRSDQKSLRQSILKLREALPAKDCQSASKEVCNRFIATLKSEKIKSGLITLYRDRRNELQTKFADVQLREMGWTLAYPRISKQGLLQFHICEEDTDWEKGTLGIEEPPLNSPLANLAEIQIVVVPGVVFDPSGNRIGMGKGHFDRVLPLIPNARRVALAYDFQIVESIHRQSWDIPMDWIITEKRMLFLK